MIGPKGKVINTLQQETGADIAVDDDGMVGTVTIGAVDGHAVEEARRRISLILDPPTAELGAVYSGRVVNLTKFGAFVSVLPGRDGLLHISKLSPLAGGKRVGAVEDVLTLGQPIEVKVDDIDPQGKVSLSLAGEFAAPAEGDHDSGAGSNGCTGNGDEGHGGASHGGAGNGGEGRGHRDPGRRGGVASAETGSGSVSFEDVFEAELRADLGDLGPAPAGGEGRPEGGERRRSRSRRR